MSSIQTHLLCLLAAAASTPVASASGLRPRTIPKHAFNFVAVYPSGLSLSTTNPPTETVSLEEIQGIVPQITLTGLNNSDPAALYTSFVGVIQEDMYRVPGQFRDYWLASWRVNQTMLKNGTLQGGQEETFKWEEPLPVFQSGEIRNASMNVWLQTAEFMNLMYTGRSGIAHDTWSDMLGLWRPFLNYKTIISWDFPQSSMNFSLDNNTASNGTGTNDDTRSAVSSPSQTLGWLVLCMSGAILVHLG